MDIFIRRNQVCINYFIDNRNDWIAEKFEKKDIINFKNTFFLSKQELDSMKAEDFIDEEGQVFEEVLNSYNYNFIVGNLVGEYFYFSKNILHTEVDVYIHKDIEIKEEVFIAKRNISIFRKLSKIINEDIYLGNIKSSNVNFDTYKKIINEFPNSTELTKYTDMRIGVILKESFDDASIPVDKYESYMNKKVSYSGINLLNRYSDYEVTKYTFILNKMKSMLENQEKYNEKEWHEEILQIILLLYPKYLKALKEVTIKDVYTGRNKRLDILLVDNNGFLDLIEIKRPKSNSFLSPKAYRNNYYPSKELSSTIMQIEKYIFCLKSWGIEGEKILNDKHKIHLPVGLELKITNPTGIIIMGRENEYNNKMKKDMEIIKRKYKNIVDIITYDELILRLELVISKFTDYAP